jgi:hypothetical protein
LGVEKIMPAKFELGKVIIKENAALVLAKAGQDADFFLAKHAAGDGAKRTLPGMSKARGKAAWCSADTAPCEAKNWW